jgi:hypothetical protein
MSIDGCWFFVFVLKRVSNGGGVIVDVKFGSPDSRQEERSSSKRVGYKSFCGLGN